jgi:predicted DNA-binding transcriptional regulator AlpA
MADIANQQLLWTLGDIMLATGWSRATAYRWVAQPDFPKPIRREGFRPQWFADEVRDFLRDQQAA